MWRFIVRKLIVLIVSTLEVQWLGFTEGLYLPFVHARNSIARLFAPTLLLVSL